MNFLHTKYIKKLFSSILTILYVLTMGIIYSGCKNVISINTIVSSNNTCQNNTTIKITSADRYILFNSADYSARTILPSSDISNFKYYLIYKDIFSDNSDDSWHIEGNLQFTPTSQTSGILSKNFEPSYYGFYLYALTEDRASYNQKLWIG